MLDVRPLMDVLREMISRLRIFDDVSSVEKALYRGYIWYLGRGVLEVASFRRGWMVMVKEMVGVYNGISVWTK